MMLTIINKVLVLFRCSTAELTLSSEALLLYTDTVLFFNPLTGFFFSIELVFFLTLDTDITLAADAFGFTGVPAFGLTLVFIAVVGLTCVVALITPSVDSTSIE